MPDVALYQHFQHLSPTLSAILVGAALLGPAALAFSAWLRRSRNLRRAASAFSAPEGLCVVAGVVELASGSDVAMRTEVDQEGSESESSGSYSWSWVETDRRVHVAPFYLVRDDGSRIRVEPSEKALLVDELDRTIVVSEKQRTKVAELLPNERVWVMGSVATVAAASDREATRAGYRDAGTTSVLRGSERQPLLVSSTPLDVRFRERAYLHTKWAGLMLLLLLSTLAFNVGYFDRALGHPSTAEVLDSVALGDRKGRLNGYAVRVDENGSVMTMHMEEALISRGTVDVLHGRWSSQLGSEPTQDRDRAVGLVFALIAALVYRSRARAALPWYRSKLVEKGTGRLVP